MSKSTLLLEAGAEGGSVQLVQIGEHFLFSTNESTLMDFDPELAAGELQFHSGVFTSFEDAMAGLLDRYELFGLCPLEVHPDFKARVITYYQEYCSQNAPHGFWGKDNWEMMLFGGDNRHSDKA